MASSLRGLLVLLFVCLAPLAVPAGDKPRPPIVPPGAKLEKVFDKGLVLTGGIAIAPDGMVFLGERDGDL